MTDNNEIPNPDKMDIQPNFKSWFLAILHGHGHVTEAGFIVLILGILVEFAISFHQVIGILLIICGTAIVVDEAAHLFSN